MCGIWALLGRHGLTAEMRRNLIRRLLPRGPEFSTMVDVSGVSLGFTRLAINGLTPAGNQPFQSEHMYVVCNGEIYNYRELAKRWNIPLAEGTSDCAVIPFLAGRLSMTELCRTLDGVFAFVFVDTKRSIAYVARDPYGVRPLFQGRTAEGGFMWASEMKGLHAYCTDIAHFPPGTWRSFSTVTGEMLESQKYHTVPHTKMAALKNRECAQRALRDSVLAAVKKRLLSDRPIGALLSGGLDSSLVAAIAARELAKQGKKLRTFSIGMPGSTDLTFAQKVADCIGSVHHNIVVSPKEFLSAIPQVIHDIESYDITSVRASVGNWLIGKYIKENTDIKVVFNGDGSDEIGGGYLYFYAAPSDEEFESETERLLDEIHIYDVLRSDRSMAAHGLEARTPFLDKNVVATWCAIDTSFRRPIQGVSMEKQILREAFESDSYLPVDVLWRKKEAFSDGVSSTADSWYLRCSEFAKAQGLGLEDILCRTAEWHNPPKTQEAYWYRMEFSKYYTGVTTIPRMWLPRWIQGANDPSARTLKDLYDTPQQKIPPVK
ncbi:MAG: asparagine synthase (glutamine-hydrolyzing) [Actinobacteria bacterium]|nr:asparagine synthase (glutamine-hydrolyzing) [Actinomycetota bacterium]